MRSGRRRRTETPNSGLASQRCPHNLPPFTPFPPCFCPGTLGTLPRTDNPFLRILLRTCRPANPPAYSSKHLSCVRRGPRGGMARKGQRTRQPTLPRTHRGVGRVRSRSPVCVSVCVRVCVVMASNLQLGPFRYPQRQAVRRPWSLRLPRPLAFIDVAMAAPLWHENGGGRSPFLTDDHTARPAPRACD